MSFIDKCLIISCFFVLTTAISQTKDLDHLFEQKKYIVVIDALQKKEQTVPLSDEDYFLLSKSYSKVNKQHLSLTILDILIPKLIEMGDLYRLSIAYNLKAENFVDLSMVDEGINFCDKRLLELEKSKAVFLQELCLKCGILYNLGRQDQKAYEVYQRITTEELKQTPVFINNYGFILMNQKKYDAAISYLKKGVDISYEANKLDYINVNLTSIARILIEKKEWSEAKKYLDSARVSFREESMVLNRKEWFITYYDYYRKQNKLDGALLVLEDLAKYNDQIYNFETQKKIKELASINERKTILGKKVTLINSEIRSTKKTKLIWFIALGCFIILITTWSLIMIYRNTRLKYLKVVKKQEVLASQMTPHFIFNSLSILQGMVLNNEHKKASEYLSKFSSLLQFIIQDELQKFVLISDEITLLENYVDLQNLSAGKDITLVFDIEESLKNKLLIPPMILQPFVENSIIHGFKEMIKKPEIKIQFKLIENKLQCIIIDNGVGLLPSKKNKNKTSLGTKIVQDRFELLSSEIKQKSSIVIEDLEENGVKGTRVILGLPYIFEK